MILGKGRDSSSPFIMPIGLICKDSEPLAFMASELESKGWKTSLNLAKRFDRRDYSCSFWVPSGSYGDFRRDIESLSIPFGLTQDYYSNYIILSDKGGK